jgi:subtilisin family serine protease
MNAKEQNDIYISLLKNVRTKLWKYSTGSGARVAVLDTGLNIEHPYFDTNKIIINKETVGACTTQVSPWNDEITNDFNDDHGHGTHVSSVICGFPTNLEVKYYEDWEEETMHGVAPEATLIPVKVLGASGSGSIPSIVAGIEWCIDNKIDIINMSLGTNQYSSSMHAAIQKAASAGIIIVCASGNDHSILASGETIDYPANLSEVIAVGAINLHTDDRAVFSSVGKELDLVAPGVDIPFKSYSGEVNVMSGTSFATPFIVGCIALIVAYRKQKNLLAYTPYEMLSFLTTKTNVIDLPDIDGVLDGFDIYTGCGKLKLDTNLFDFSIALIPIVRPVSEEEASTYNKLIIWIMDFIKQITGNSFGHLFDKGIRYQAISC